MKFHRPGRSIDELRAWFEGGDRSRERSAVKTRQCAMEVLWYLDRGELRVWEPGSERVNAWVKEAILSFFRVARAWPMGAGAFEYFDKLPVKRRASLKGVRVVPGAVVRFGAFVEPDAVLMPSFVNVGARVGRGTMIDAWATVGSCAQIGAGVHVSGGAGIGGVLEPLQARPVLIEDGVFVGSRAVVVEGVRVRRGAVLGAGVVLTASTRIIDVRGSAPVALQGEVPERAVLIPGSVPRKFAAGEYGVPCALIVGTRNDSTDLKTSLNDALREHGVPV